MLLALAIVIAAAMLSVWIFARFRGRAPESFRTAMIHLGLSLVAFYVLRPLLTPAADALASPADTYAFVFVLVLPALTYRFLSTLWMLNLVQQLARGRH